MNTQSTLKVFKSGNYEYIYIYFKLGKNLIRINTKNKVIKNNMTTEFLYKANVENYKNLNKATTELRNKVNAYLMLKLRAPFPIVDQKECEHFITTDYYKNVFDGKPYLSSKLLIKSDKNINDHFIDFYNYKSIELNQRLGLKDYKSLQNALSDYCQYVSKPLSLKDINNKEFILNFRNFLSIKHPDNYLTKGQLNDNTINKRLSALKTFYSYIEENELFTFKKQLFKIENSGYDNNVVVLSLTEIKQLMELKLNDIDQVIIDIFVMNCFLCLRFSDLRTLTMRDFFKDNDGNIILKKENKKTGFYSEVPVNNTALTILEKYNYNIQKFTNQYFNRQLQTVLKENDLFPELVVKKRRSLKENKDFSIMKRELITSHTCRRSFITNCINANIPIPSIMLASAHHSIRSINLYIKKMQDAKQFKAIDVA